MRVRGLGGEVRAGGRVVARLGAWTLAPSADGGHPARRLVSAAVRERDAFWTERGGSVELRLRAGSVEWVWPDAEAEWGEGMDATVTGAPEVS